MKSLLLFAASLLAGTLSARAQEVPPIPTDSTVKVVKTPAGYTTQLNAVYSKVGPWEGRIDLYLNSASRRPTPIILNVHGGGWSKGAKETQSGFNSYLKQGWSVANMEYRLAPYAPAPAAVEDVRCAIIYLMANAKKLNIDPTRIVLVGTSNGAQLALLAGLLENDHRFDTNCPTTETVKVRAVVDKYGATDLPSMTNKSANQWLGAHAKDEAFVQSMSPMSYVKKTSPPVILIHGDADPSVPYAQAVALNQRLKAEGVKTELVTIPGGQNGKFSREENNRVNEAIVRFLQAQGL